MSVARDLLAWYHAHRRPLPWRETSDPYAIWVSEAMLQQTRVDTVIPYYHRFLEAFPTAHALAAADLDAVLKRWEGLGYYSRARNLHRAAGRVVVDHGGHLPGTAAELAKLPGFGPYMSAAVASIAFGEAVPVMDGNVARILTRKFAIGEPPAGRATRARLLALAGGMMPADAAGDFNQAMMELGATVCTPKGPDCGACPWAAGCAARIAGTPEAFPMKVAKRASPHHDIAVAVVERDGELLLVRRPERGLLGGLWEFPGGRCDAGETPCQGVGRRLQERFGLPVEPIGALSPVRHVFTHRKVTLHPFRCRAGEGEVRPVYHVEHRWVPLSEVGGLALPRAHEKIAAALRAGESA